MSGEKCYRDSHHAVNDSEWKLPNLRYTCTHLHMVHQNISGKHGKRGKGQQKMSPLLKFKIAEVIRDGISG